MTASAVDSIAPLAGLFAPADRQEWLALAGRALKGKALESLRSRTSDGVVIEPLYAPDKATPAQPFDIAPRPLERSWDIRAPVSHPDIAVANAQIREALDGGAASVLVGLDPSGEGGVAVGGAGDMTRLLEGVLTDIAPVAIDAGFLGPHAAHWLSQATKASPAAPLCFHLNPLGALAQAGVSPGPIEAHLALSAQTAARLAATHPRASLFLASGTNLHEAGASEASEVAFAAASAIAYVGAMETAGLPPEQAFPRVVVGLAADGDPLVSIAKLRAARMVWRRITAACASTCTAAIEVRSSRRMLAKADPWTNLVRLTAAGFAAGAGGADAVVLGAFTDAVGQATAHARRLARNTGLVLMEEGHVGAVADPGGGSWAFESLSEALARSAWDKLRLIEGAGGAALALTSGLIDEWVKEGRQGIEKRLGSGELKIVGLSVFRPDKAESVEVEAAAARPVSAPDPRQPGEDSRCAPLEPILLEDLAS